MNYAVPDHSSQEANSEAENFFHFNQQGAHHGTTGGSHSCEVRKPECGCWQMVQLQLWPRALVRAQTPECQEFHL